MADDTPIPGLFSWNELMTTDVEDAKDFYGKLLGWEFEDWPHAPSGQYVVIKNGPREAGGMMPKPPMAPDEVPPHWGAYITVADVDATAARAEELGGNLVLPPMDIPRVGRMAVIQDRQGAVIQLITYLPRN